MKKIIITIGFCVISVFAHAASPKFATNLQYQNQPIDARCFESNGTVPLGDCTHNDTSTEKVSGHNAFLIDKGFIGADYVSVEKEKFPAGYSYYKVLGSANGEYIVYTINSGGGSGEFTALKLVKLKEDQLYIQTIKAGDRCNGGVNEVKLNQETLTFEINITPYDLIDLSGSNNLKFLAYDDIAACAACCIGKAVYEVNINDAAMQTLKTIKLDNDYQQDEFNGAKQVCFNKVLLDFTKGKQTLSPDDLKEFSMRLDKVCH